jgi:GYF domain 2
MLYQVTRNGQSYGPYTLEDLQRYVASGNVLPTDLAKSEEMADWAPVAHVLGGSTAEVGGAIVAPYAVGGAPAYQGGVAPYPDPPNLHWALVLLIGIFTCGLFLVVWEFVQAVWMRKVNPRSNALFFYIGAAVVGFGGSFARFGLMATSGFHNQYLILGISTSLISFVLAELAFFDMRRSMEEHFNGREPIGLSLSGVMTFFFGYFYFQYHFTRINELKRIARYRGAAI